MLLYPVYAVLFAETGLSPGEISSLFVIWSVTSSVIEVPSGLWADVFSRRRLLIVGPLLTGSGFALWTFLPSYPAFALGFVLWGAGGALRSGTMQALVYEELDRLGTADAYARLIGRSEAIGTTAVMTASALAGPVFAVGGYLALGLASVAVTLITALVGWTFPESRASAEDRQEETFMGVLRAGLGEVRGAPLVRRLFLLLTVISGAGALDEYLPLLARATGVSTAVVPVLVLVVTFGATVGGWLAGRAPRALAPALAVGGLCLAAGAASGRPAGFALIAVAFGIFQWATAAVDARLQEAITDRSRATVTSMAGLGVEAMAVIIFAAYALGSIWAGPWLIFTVAAVPYLLVALAVRR
ncbi:MFS transporter [Planotetraspora kaengkrachanensis]|uniref:MFS transporter n=1 Tax=Planotetraspora kaengkrachanensis TaxID=575193 RepID=A0A8J3PTT9_9ACTN|nr:MFS transporter [Planotetraspora kaengkrachanensis]GIG80910.1 MFS transporter [Planotetraspora kaengkrachanensis]